MSLVDKIPKDYPYLNARIRAKGAQLLDRNDYENLLKMKSNGIARKLEEGQYSREINELGSMLDGTELVETALQRNATRTLVELVDESSGSLEEILKVYVRRYDIESLKRLLRKKKQGEELGTVVTPGFEYPIERLEKMHRNEREEIINSIEFEGALVDYSEYISAEQSLEEFERGIDQAYFDELEKLADKTGNKRLERFLRKELEYENLRIVIRLKRYDIEAEEIRNRCFNCEASNLVQACIDAADFDEMLQLIRDSDWEIGMAEEVEEVEHQLKVSRLRSSLKNLRTAPLGLAPIMSFVVAKMVEVDNLRMMVQAKSTGAQDADKIRENLVISR
ncbi:V-type ATPase subunit [Candidatus Nanosalina sp. VS9-1]|uniref:V-type ATPase subunit n=1 Tax=Candidatus Nanosalina sp. VS9-1 TaxID=3388566 RepID=UPI0039E1676D